MIIEFDKDYLRELYTEGRTNDKKHRYQPEVIRGYQKAVFVLSSASLRLGNTFKITFDSLACLITAMLFGPLDAFLVGFIGEFLAQVLSYGITATTFLWMLAPALRGLVMGIGVKLFREKMSLPAILKHRSWLYMVFVVLSSVAASLMNTAALYVDSKMFGYYEYHMVFGVLLIRLGTGIVSSVLMAIIAVPVLQALYAAHAVPVNSMIKRD